MWRLRRKNNKMFFSCLSCTDKLLKFLESILPFISKFSFLLKTLFLARKKDYELLNLCTAANIKLRNLT
jgi:hypothetical protein